MARMVALFCVAACGMAACAREGDGLSVDDKKASAAGQDRGVVSGQDPAGPQHRPHAGMLRYPDVGAKQIVFVYANDLWLVSRDGGVAVPLASPPGQELFPRFSPDGSTIAFMGNYDGNQDIYTIGAGGGMPHRVTHHPSSESLCDWTPAGRLVFSTYGLAGLGRQRQLFTVSSDGGLPEKLPVPYGANGAVSPDGQWLAYTPHSRDARTWKRYRGGMATDIWLFHLEEHTSKLITDWEGTDSLPMWHGQTVYYLSDAGPNHRLNIWSYNTKTSARKQVTRFKDYDVKWPSIGPGADGRGEIVFQNGSALHLLDLGSGESRTIEVMIPGDRPKIRPQTVDAGSFMASGGVSSTGKRVVFEARGDIWTVPAEKGSPRNLTRTSGVAERDPSWSPDGQWIAYFSDATGEYELYITQSDGQGDTKQLTTDGELYRYSPTWLPDSKMLTFSDKSGTLYLHTVETGEAKLIDTDPQSRRLRVSWSHDSHWLAYAKSGENLLAATWLYDVDAGEKRQVTRGMFNDSLPTFDRKGDFLFLASNREFSRPMYEDIGSTFIYADTDVLLAVPLRKDVEWPLAPESDEEAWGEEADDENGEDDDDEEDDNGEEEEESDDEEGDEEAADEAATDDADEGDEKEKDEEEEEEEEPLVIDLEAFEQRAMKLPVKKGSFYSLSVNHKGQLIYTRGAPRGGDGKTAIKLFDMEDKKGEKKHEEKTVVDDAGGFQMTADGKKLLVYKGGSKMYIVEAKADRKLKKKVPVEGMTTTVDPRAEWRQMFNDVWRIERDFFYDPNMHGVDWEAVRERYGKMLADCVCREDVTFVIGEMISELNVGHAYARGGGDGEKPPRVSVGMLGCDFELHEGAYRISKICGGASWDVDARGPLGRPGLDVKAGDYLLAVNAVPVDTKKDPWAALQGLAGRVVTLTVSEKPVMDDDAREVVVKPASSDRGVRYRAWIERNRSTVDRKSDGRVGYIYVPDTGRNGQNNLIRQYYGQRDKAALIIDERWNGGGQIPTRFIELLNRPVTNYWAVRHGADWVWPRDAHHGPKCMLINGLAGSGGDCFPYYFRQAKIGKLIGTRTWGGLVGISGNPRLIDGGGVTAPTFAFYETDGTWGVEGHGVDPDIEVVDDPALMVDGGDPQLDAAIALMLEEIEKHPFAPPKRPAYPDRSGMGIREDDK